MITFACVHALLDFLACVEKNARIGLWLRPVGTGRMVTFAWMIVTGNTWLTAAPWHVASAVSKVFLFLIGFQPTVKTDDMVLIWFCSFTLPDWLKVSRRLLNQSSAIRCETKTLFAQERCLTLLSIFLRVSIGLLHWLYMGNVIAFILGLRLLVKSRSNTWLITIDYMHPG